MCVAVELRTDLGCPGKIRKPYSDIPDHRNKSSLNGVAGRDWQCRQRKGLTDPDSGVASFALCDRHGSGPLRAETVVEPGPDPAAAALLQFSAEPLRMAAAIAAGDSLAVRLAELAEEDGCRLRPTGTWTSATVPLLPLLTCGNAVVTAAFVLEPGAGASQVEVLVLRPVAVIMAYV